MGGFLSKLYLGGAGFLLLMYIGIETRGTVFGGTDRKPSAAYSRSGGTSSSRSGGRRGGSFFFWGSGYRGGK